jgi:type II restriction/modification system DNA methylase subunit YeeA
MPIIPQEFVTKWKRVTSRERQAVQEHFIDLCALVGHPTPNEYDPSGTRFAFEMGVGKTSGGQGWADIAKLGYFGWEYKGKDHDLDKAYTQLLLYRDNLQNPPVLVVSDINNIVIRTNYTNVPTRTITLSLDDLLKPENIKTLKAVFFNPDELKPQITSADVTQEAAKQFAQLAGILRKYGEDNARIAHFLIRLLFCLFAEDIGLLPARFFPQLLDNTRRNAKDFAEALRQLFRAMKGGGMYGNMRILHFNGGLFDDDNVLELDSDSMDIIAAIDSLDWSAIEPSIFGTLFERGLDPNKRSELGAHYTDKKDIVMVVEPVLMAPLRREWDALQQKALALKVGAEKLTEKKRATAMDKISKLLRAFADRISAIRVLDPACGSGNFLYVALQLLLDLQNEVINFSDQLGLGRWFITVSPSQLYGIEKNEYAHELAQVTIWIGYIQWMINHGYGHSEPILRSMDNIRRMDAILAFDEQGKPYEPEWQPADVIVGNPPFLGGNKIRAELGDVYVDALFKLYDGRVPATADLVCYWFEKARAMIENKKLQRAGLLATQGIRGGTNRSVLENIKATGDIFWAFSDRNWFLNGATVHVSMIAFDNGNESEKLLNGIKVEKINPDLSALANVASAIPLTENANLSFRGNQKGGAFDISDDLASKMLSAPNPNGKRNSDVIKKTVNGMDITQTSRNVWLIDFGLSMSLQDAAQYEIPFEYIKEHVYPERMKNNRKAYRDRWWIHLEPRPSMRRAISNLKRFIVTPHTSKHRIFIWLDKQTVPDHALVVFAREDDYFLGILQSRIHEIWSLSTGTQLREIESGFRYTPNSIFETFPFPWAPGKEPTDDPRVQAIAQAAKELVEQRDRWLNAEGLSDAERKKRTLTNLYNARPTWLDLAHKKLDNAVFDAYGWSHNLSDDEILEKLLALNLERAQNG